MFVIRSCITGSSSKAMIASASLPNCTAAADESQNTKKERRSERQLKMHIPVIHEISSLAVLPTLFRLE